MTNDITNDTTIDMLRYPFDVPLIARKRRGLREQLLAGGPFTDVKVAILGGSTTADIEDFLELFLLAAGIRPTLYVSEYNRFYEEAVVDDAALRAFAPDVVFVHTTHRNIGHWPKLLATDTEVDAALAAEYGRFESVWNGLLERTDCLVVQNNFDPPAIEPLGHLGATAGFGKSSFVARLNGSLAALARRTPRLRVVDIHSLAAHVGLSSWASARHWHHYRMALTPEGSALVAHSVARIIRAAFGKSRKCLVLDLDDTLWGGVIGDEGVNALRLGHETPEGEAFLSFQQYCLALKERGVLLAVCSKNNPAIARAGFRHPDSVLSVDDFSAFVANWDPKPDNLRAIAAALGIGLDALVFVDDNPAEQAFVRRELPEVAVPSATHVTSFAEMLDREGYFEPFTLGTEDLQRTAYLQQNAARAAVAPSTGVSSDDYGAYLDSLAMTAEIGPITPPYFDRVTQLVNKTNQFNLTTRRYTPAQIESIARSPEYVTLYAKLTDRFGENGLVSVVLGRRVGSELHIEAWLMSCRVLKRSLELAMFDALVDAARRRGIDTLIGYYEPSPKNAMVATHYESLAFERSNSEGGTATVWRLRVAEIVCALNTHIQTRGSCDGRHHPETDSAVSRCAQ
ncbi:MAG: FkbH like protein [Myxococcaceae bacterium]|nr:FkbH like protein [Myxococcaceae bacterium]